MTKTPSEIWPKEEKGEQICYTWILMRFLPQQKKTKQHTTQAMIARPWLYITQLMDK